MERIGHEEERVDESRRLRRQHRRLASPVRLPAEEERPWPQIVEGLQGRSQTLAIARSAGRVWWPRTSRLPVWEIAPKDEQSSRSKGRRDGDQERHRAVTARAVREHESSARGRRGPMHEPVDGRNTLLGAVKRLGVWESGHPSV